jgi:hypothetical protein
VTGYGNCDGAFSNGCETDLLYDPYNCGSCGAQCSPGSSCVGGQCLPSGCGPSTCPDGCCMDGYCVLERTVTTCGYGGQACVSCAPEQSCNEPGICQ